MSEYYNNIIFVSGGCGQLDELHQKIEQLLEEMRTGFISPIHSMNDLAGFCVMAIGDKWGRVQWAVTDLIKRSDHPTIDVITGSQGGDCDFIGRSDPQEPTRADCYHYPARSDTTVSGESNA